MLRSSSSGGLSSHQGVKSKLVNILQHKQGMPRLESVPYIMSHQSCTCSTAPVPAMCPQGVPDSIPPDSSWLLHWACHARCVGRYPQCLPIDVPRVDPCHLLPFFSRLDCQVDAAAAESARLVPPVSGRMVCVLSPCPPPRLPSSPCQLAPHQCLPVIPHQAASVLGVGIVAEPAHSTTTHAHVSYRPAAAAHAMSDVIQWSVIYTWPAC